MSVVVAPRGKHFVAIDQFSRDIVTEGDAAAAVIETAVTAAGVGEVMLEAGVYPLDRPIELTDGSTLRGRGRGTKLIASPDFGDDGKDAPDTATPLLLIDGKNGVTVADLSLAGLSTGAGTGIVAAASAEVTIRDARVSGFREVGICLRDSTALSRIESCTLAGNGNSAILLYYLAEGKWGNFIPNLVSNCMIYGGGRGIVTAHAVVANIVGTVVYQTGGHAFHLTDRSNSIVLSGCRSFQITGHAVLAENSHEINVSSNVFCWHTEDGIVARECDWGTLTGNEIIDNGSYNPGGPDKTIPFEEVAGRYENKIGIVLDRVRGFTVSANAVFNWGVCPPMSVGIRESAGSKNNIITANNVNYYLNEAVTAEGSGTVVEDNVEFADEAYRSMIGRIQSFEPHLTEKLIREMP